MSAQEPQQTSRISVSEEKLRAILAEFKLELAEEFAKKAPLETVELLRRHMEELVNALSSRLLQIELWRAAREGANREKRDLNGRQLAWAALVAALVSSFATIAWLHHG